MPEVVVSGGCLNIAAQGGASWKHQNHREGVQQRPWQISFAMVNHKINEREILHEPELYQVGITPDQIVDEVTQGAMVMASELGHRPKHFAYPYSYRAAANRRDLN